MDFINILSYNTTGLDPVKINWINELLKTFDISLFQIQEHFKAIKSINRFFSENFSEFHCHVRPAVRENLNSAGRPKGGLCQFVSKNSEFKKEPVPCQNWRIQSQILHHNQYKLLWINVYLPTDPQTQQLNEYELVSTISDIENIINKSKFSDIVIGGDFNYDESRTSRFCNIFKEAYKCLHHVYR